MSADPTRTSTLRAEYAQRLRGVLAAINAEIRRALVDRDEFALQAARDPDPLTLPPFTSDDAKIEEFQRWLRDQERRGVLEVIQRDENTYVRSAYARGFKDANANLRAQGVDVPEADLQAAFNRPIHAEQLQTLFTRNFNEWEGVTEAMNQQVSRELTDGLAQGQNPRTIGRNIADRVEKVGKKRATDLARSEVVRSHANATLNRYEELGVKEVAGEAEFSSADDRRVCSICRSLDGNTYLIDDARGIIPQHPRCRCTFVPVISSTQQQTLSASIPIPS